MRVYCDMVGDLFHYGHINFLREAKKIGDFVIVGLMSDEEALAYKRRPILSLEERRKEIEGCKYVDLVILNCPCPVTKEFIEEYKIDYVLHGDDYTKEELEKWYSAAKKLHKLKLVPYTKGISTSEIIDRIKNQNS
ncbi:MAG: adenylyltransferase/cytidyltransferase family protein [archaeon]